MKVKKILALVLSMLLMVSSMAVATLPVAAEDATIPTVLLHGWATEGGQNYSTTVTGLTAGETYKMKVLYKKECGVSRFTADDIDLIKGDTLADGVTYDAATSTLTYTFLAADADINFGLKLTENGNWNGAYVANLLVEDFLGNNVYEAKGAYTDGTLTGFEGWGNGGWGGGLSFSEQTADFFGVDLSTWDTPVSEEEECTHEYDDKYDASCNLCGVMREAPIRGKAYGISAQGWANENTQGYGMSTGDLVEGNTYTLSFLWKVDNGVPYVAVSGTAVGETFNIVEGMTVLNGATYGADGRVSYTFTAQGNDVSFYGIMNTASTNYSKYSIADVKIVDAQGNVVKEGGFTAYDGWGSTWGGFNGGAWTTFDAATFACAHDFTDLLDTDCSICDVVRTYPTLKLWEWGYKEQVYGVDVTGLTAGATYTATMLYKPEAGKMKVTFDGATLIEGSLPANGALYNPATGLVTYTFTAADADARIQMQFTTAGNSGNWNGAYLSGLNVVDAEGNTVYTTKALYNEDGTVGSFEGWTNGGWWGGISFAENDLSFFAGAACAHAYDGACDTTCNICGEVREVNDHEYDDCADTQCNLCGVTREPQEHEYDDENDGDCNKCGALVEGFVNAVFGQGWTNENSLGYTHSAGLTAGEQYTISFYWKGVSGVYFYVGNTDTRIVEGMTVANGATFSETGRVSYTFTADAETVGFGVVLNTAGIGYGAFTLADVVIVDAQGNVVYRNNTDTDPNKGWGWTGWSNRWDSNAHGFTFSNMNVDTFACGHVFDNDCDDTCNVCGSVRAIEGHVYGGECDADCNKCGEVREAPEHTFDNDCDDTCDVCGTVREAGHVFEGDFCVNCGMEYTVAAPKLQSYGNGGSYYTTITGLTVGETYTFTILRKSLSGAPWLSFGGVTLMTGTVAENGATYDCETGRLTYTFTAEATSVNLSENNGETKDCWWISYLADAKVLNAEGTAVWEDPDFSEWTKTSYGLNESDLTSKKPLSFFAHYFDADCDTTCALCGETRETEVEHEYDHVCDAECNNCGEIREVAGHAYDHDCDDECNNCGEIREVAGHAYDNDCDADCNNCGETREVADHVYDDDADTDCNVCGAVRAVGPARMPGDVTGDGKINTKDMMYLQRYVNGWDIEIILANADVTGDGKVNTKDYMYVQRYVNGWDIELI